MTLTRLMSIRNGVLALVAGCAVLTAGIALAQTSGNDTYLDPLAYTRVNTQAEPVTMSIKYLSTGETRMATGRYLLTDSGEMYIRSASLARRPSLPFSSDTASLRMAE